MMSLPSTLEQNIFPPTDSNGNGLVRKCPMWHDKTSRIQSSETRTCRCLMRTRTALSSWGRSTTQRFSRVFQCQRFFVVFSCERFLQHRYHTLHEENLMS
ncbi:hypothetical protein AHAS_Ahas08G0102700 [Arachis hypogaea]